MYSFSLISLYFAVSTTYASPLPLTNSAISSWTPPQHHLGKQNTVVAVMPQSRVHFEPSLDSIGIEISKSASSKTIEDAEAERFWLPVGERVYVRDNPFLPTHPSSARVFDIIPETGTSTLGRAMCVIYPVMTAAERLARKTTLAHNSIGARSVEDPMPKEPSIVLRGYDGSVDFEIKGERYLAGREVESYECF